MFSSQKRDKFHAGIARSCDGINLYANSCSCEETITYIYLIIQNSNFSLAETSPNKWMGEIMIWNTFALFMKTDSLI